MLHRLPYEISDHDSLTFVEYVEHIRISHDAGSGGALRQGTTFGPIIAPGAALQVAQVQHVACLPKPYSSIVGDV